VSLKHIDRSSCVHELIADQSSNTPDAVALVAGDLKLTYAQLNARANQFARFLRTRGVGPEILVGLRVKRSVEMVVGMLGILKAGGAYVPLNPNDPEERQSFELLDSGAKLLVTTDDLPETVSVDSRRVVFLDSDWPQIAHESQADLDPAAGPSSPAYVIYTSGSTGRPKGVVVTHSGLANYLSWAARKYGREARRSALVYSSISFDLTITGLYTPLLLGGQVELIPDDSVLEALVVALRRPEIRGLVKITPAHLAFLSQQLRPEEASGKVELFVIGGENLLAENLRFWREVSPTTRLINEYGPTETVVGCCVYEVRSDDPFTGSVPIGKAIDNTQLYVLNQRLEPEKASVVGELYIGGAGVARGYLNRSDLTREHFLPDPFSSEPGARMYKSGDMARYQKDGTLEYVGRCDDQVKIRGYRVELGEVESVASGHTGVRQFVAAVHEDQPGHKQLVGYVIPRHGQTVAQNELKEFLSAKLPKYMVPTHLVFLDDFPLTPNGKVDRRALPTPTKTSLRREVISPRSSTESRLVEIWKELLQVNPLSVTDDFFDLGGDSLLAAGLMVRVEQLFGKRISMATLFQAPTIQQLAAVLETHVPSASRVIPIQPGGLLPPFFCIGAGPLFRPLSSRLGTDRPFLSLMPSYFPELKRSSARYRLEQVAIDLVNCILDCQKEGPYYLGGWSASGVVAYETARQLIEMGREVALLIMFDTANPAFQRYASKDAGWKSRGEKLKFQASELLALPFRNAPAYARDKMKELHRRIRNASWRARDRILGSSGDGPIENPDQVLHLAINSYQAPPYSGSVVFFKAGEVPPGDAWDLSGGWRHLIKGDFKVYETAGDHRSMFLEPNVANLADKMINEFCRKRMKPIPLRILNRI
jgi:amino acid adenylation domain-containing protein